MKTVLKALLMAAVLLPAAPVLAADHTVEMLNRGDAGTMVFQPAALQVEPGDTVTFVPTDKGHNVEFINGLTPEGVAPFRSNFSEEVTLTFDVPGLYVVKCTPHFAMGMIAAIQVGNAPPNLEAVKAATLPGNQANQRLNAALGELEL